MRRLFGIGILFLILSSWHHSNKLYSYNTLTKHIEAEFESEIIDFNKLNDFEWNELVILGPYSTIKNVEKELNIDLENIKENGIEHIDFINLLIFLNDGKPVRISEVSRGIGDFTNLRQIIQKDKAKFVKTENGQNKLSE